MNELRFHQVTPNASGEALSQLQQLAESTFVETFGFNYSTKDLNEYLTERLSEQALSEELANVNNRFYFVERDGQAVGYIKACYNTARYLDNLERPLKANSPFLLERFYFKQAFQGKGLAPVALEFILSLSKHELTCDYCYLSVWEHNHRAQRFYQGFGFRTLGAMRYVVGESQDHEFLYGKPL